MERLPGNLLCGKRGFLTGVFVDGFTAEEASTAWVEQRGDEQADLGELGLGGRR